MPSQSRDSLFDEDFLMRLQRLQLLAKRMAGRLSAGMQRSVRLGDGLEFADHRAYAPGDDIRFVDWPYYARMEKLLLRLFHQQSEGEVAILLDRSGSMAPQGQQEKFRYALRASAALAYIAMTSLDRVTLQPFGLQLGQAMKTGRSAAQLLKALDFLAAIEASGRTNLAGCIEHFARQSRVAKTVFVISDLLDCTEQLSGALARLRQRSCDVTLLHVYSSQDAEPRLAGAVVLDCAETGRQMPLEATEAVLESYHQQWNDFQAGCERTCGSCTVTYIASPTDRPFEKLILTTLRRAGILGG